MQTIVVRLCSIAALIGFSLWFYSEPSYEPAIGFIAGLSGIAHSCWPKRTKKYANRRLKGRESFDYSNNNGLYVIGSDDLKFETKWSKASDQSIHVYNDPASIKAIALVKGLPAINQISSIKDYDFSSRSRTPQEGEIVLFENSYGNFAAVKIIDIKDCTRSDSIDELTFVYIINPDGLVDFS